MVGFYCILSILCHPPVYQNPLVTQKNAEKITVGMRLVEVEDTFGRKASQIRPIPLYGGQPGEFLQEHSWYGKDAHLAVCVDGNGRVEGTLFQHYGMPTVLDLIVRDVQRRRDSSLYSGVACFP